MKKVRMPVVGWKLNETITCMKQESWKGCNDVHNIVSWRGSACGGAYSYITLVRRGTKASVRTSSRGTCSNQQRHFVLYRQDDSWMQAIVHFQCFLSSDRSATEKELRGSCCGGKQMAYAHFFYSSSVWPLWICESGRIIPSRQYYCSFPSQRVRPAAASELRWRRPASAFQMSALLASLACCLQMPAPLRPVTGLGQNASPEAYPEAYSEQYAIVETNKVYNVWEVCPSDFLQSLQSQNELWGLTVQWKEHPRFLSVVAPSPRSLPLHKSISHAVSNSFGEVKVTSSDCETWVFVK